MPEQKKYRVAVVGLGVGKQHAVAYKSLSSFYDLVCLCSLEDDANRALAEELNVPETTTSYDSLVLRDDIDIIDICTPPMLHLPQAKAALLAGKHVVCEKPVAKSIAAVDELIHVERESGRRLMPVFQYRFGQGLQKLLHLRERGLTGKPFVASVEVHWRRGADYYAVPWRGKFATELGGALTTHAIHALDMLTYVLGPVQSVYAQTATQVNPIEVEDAVAATLKMQNGALVTLSVTLGSTAEITRHRFVFERLVAESNTRPYTNSGDPWTFTPDRVDEAPAIQAELEAYDRHVQQNPIHPPPVNVGTGVLRGYEPPARYEAQIALMYGALQNNLPFPVTLQDARNSIELLSALYESAKTDVPVTLPIDHQHPVYRGWHL
jgi:predicted dehydrogenase